MKCWLPDALTHISNTTVTWYRGIEVEDWRNKKCFPDPPKFVRSGNLDLCVWLGFCSGLSSCPALPCCRVICSCCESWFCAEFSSNCGDTATSGWDEHQTLQKCIHSQARSCSRHPQLQRQYYNCRQGQKLGPWQLSAPGLQQTACRVSPLQPAGSSGEVTPDGPGPAALQRCPCQETGRCPTACSIRSSPCSLTADCYMLSRAGVDILTVQG